MSPPAPPNTDGQCMWTHLAMNLFCRLRLCPFTPNKSYYLAFTHLHTLALLCRQKWEPSTCCIVTMTTLNDGHKPGRGCDWLLRSLIVPLGGQSHTYLSQVSVLVSCEVLTHSLKIFHPIFSISNSWDSFFTDKCAMSLWRGRSIQWI